MCVYKYNLWRILGSFFVLLFRLSHSVWLSSIGALLYACVRSCINIDIWMYIYISRCSGVRVQERRCWWFTLPNRPNVTATLTFLLIVLSPFFYSPKHLLFALTLLSHFARSSWKEKKSDLDLYFETDTKFRLILCSWLHGVERQCSKLVLSTAPGELGKN